MDQPKKVSLVNYYYYVLAPLAAALVLFGIITIFRLRPIQVASGLTVSAALDNIRRMKGPRNS